LATSRQYGNALLGVHDQEEVWLQPVSINTNTANLSTGVFPILISDTQTKRTKFIAVPQEKVTFYLKEALNCIVSL